MEGKMIGIIKWFKKEKGYGYIIGFDDETYFFELIDCINKDESFNKDDKVTYIPKYKGIYYATEVEKVDNE